MGMDYSSGTTPGGRAMLVLMTSGKVTADDVARFGAAVKQGGPHHGLPMLAHVAKDADFSMDARKGFANLGDATGDSPIAVVMSSAPLRMIINFIVKASNLKRSQPTNLKFFEEESAALAWLDAQMTKST